MRLLFYVVIRTEAIKMATLVSSSARLLSIFHLDMALPSSLLVIV